MKIRMPDIDNLNKNYTRDHLRTLAKRLRIKLGRSKLDTIKSLLISKKISVKNGRIVITNVPSVNTLQEWFDIRDAIDAGKFYGCITKVPKYRKNVIYHLVLTKTTFRSKHFGAGVYKILP